MLDLKCRLCYRYLDMATTKKKTSTRTSRAKRTSSVTKVKPRRAFRTYAQAMKYLFEMTDYEKQQRLRYNVDTFDLGRMERLLRALGNQIGRAHV